MALRFVGVKLVPAEMQALDQLVVLFRYSSRSSVLRAGLHILFERHKLKPDVQSSITRERRRHPPRESRRFGLDLAKQCHDFERAEDPKRKRGSK